MKRARLRPRSQKAMDGDEARNECRAIVLARAGGRCEVAPVVPGVRCWHPFGKPLDVHEIKTRGRGGSIFDPDNCLAACRRHHDWIDENQITAHALGLLRHSWEEEEPVVVDGGAG